MASRRKRAATTATAAAQVLTKLPQAPGWWDALRAVDYCTLNCPRWNAGGGAGGASPAMGCRSKAGQEQEERNRFAPGYKPSPLQCLISASLPNFMILYDTLGIYVRLGALGVPLRLLMPLYFVLLAWQ